MTTIALHYKSKTIAVDGRKTMNGIVSNDTDNKITVNELGAWITTGAVCDIVDFVKLKKNDTYNKDVKLEVSGLLVSDGIVYYVFMADGIFCQEEINHNFTLGSGSQFATAAMDHGKSAKEAVKYAITRDIYSGGRVRVFNV